MRVKALVSFAGALTMSCGEVRECSDNAVLADLLDAGYIVECEPEAAGEDPPKKKRVKKDEGK